MTGPFFEDFHLGERLRHAPSRTLGDADAALYGALTGSRFALQTSAPFARGLGYRASPLDDLLVFNTVFGQSVPDVSQNAIANLGYAEGRFFRPVYPGETLHATSEVIGLKQNSSGDSGVVYVRTDGFDEHGERVLHFARWVMLPKRDANSPAPAPHIPELAGAVPGEALQTPAHVRFDALYDTAQSGSPLLWGDYAVGARIDHGGGATVGEAEHKTAARLYRNTARVHFSGDNRFGKPVVYGGHALSLARALSFDGLANAVQILAINAGRHVAPVFAGDALYAWSEVLDHRALRKDCGALRLRLIATKNRPCADFPPADAKGVVLDFDTWALMPRA